jgi:hypothetical protein
MELDKPVANKRSLGSLRRAQKGKPKSPDMTGTLTFQLHTATTILKQFKEANSQEVICNLAGWRNEESKGNPYLTVEVSSRYTQAKSSIGASSNLDFIFEDQEVDE